MDINDSDEGDDGNNYNGSDFDDSDIDDDSDNESDCENNQSLNDIPFDHSSDSLSTPASSENIYYHQMPVPWESGALRTHQTDTATRKKNRAPKIWDAVSGNFNIFCMNDATEVS